MEVTYDANDTDITPKDLLILLMMLFDHFIIIIIFVAKKSNSLKSLLAPKPNSDTTIYFCF